MKWKMKNFSPLCDKYQEEWNSTSTQTGRGNHYTDRRWGTKSQIQRACRGIEIPKQLEFTSQTHTHTHPLPWTRCYNIKGWGLRVCFSVSVSAGNCNGWGGDTGSMSSPQCTGGGQGTSELRVHKCSYERPHRMQHPLTWSSSVHLLLLFSQNQQHSPPSIQPHSLCSVPAGSSFSVDFGHRLLTTKVWSWITNTSLSGTAAKTQAGSQKVLVPVPLHHPQSHQLAGQSSKAGKQEASGFAISDR